MKQMKGYRQGKAIAPEFAGIRGALDGLAFEVKRVGWECPCVASKVLYLGVECAGIRPDGEGIRPQCEEIALELAAIRAECLAIARELPGVGSQWTRFRPRLNDIVRRLETVGTKCEGIGWMLRRRGEIGEIIAPEFMESRELCGWIAWGARDVASKFAAIASAALEIGRARTKKGRARNGKLGAGEVPRVDTRPVPSRG